MITLPSYVMSGVSDRATCPSHTLLPAMATKTPQQAWKVKSDLQAFAVPEPATTVHGRRCVPASTLFLEEAWQEAQGGFPWWLQDTA